MTLRYIWLVAFENALWLFGTLSWRTRMKQEARDQNQMERARFPDPRRVGFIDAARGAAIASMIIINYPGSSKTIWHPFRHGGWDDWSFADIIFPWFLVIGGWSMVLSAQGRSDQKHTGRFVIRCGKLYLAGLLISCLAAGGFNFSPGTLERIAISFLLAYPFLNFPPAALLTLISALFIVHWALFVHLRAPGVPWDLRWSHGSTIAEYLDLVVRGKPKAVCLSFIGMVGSVLIGVAAGRCIRLERGIIAQPGSTIIAGLAAVATGLFFTLLPTQSSLHIPMIPKLWTPSFILFSGGITVLICTLLSLLSTRPKIDRLLHPLTVFGINSFAVYFLLDLLDVALQYGGRLVGDGSKSLRKAAYESMAAYLPAGAASALTAVTMLLLGYLFCSILFQKRIIIRL